MIIEYQNTKKDLMKLISLQVRINPKKKLKGTFSAFFLPSLFIVYIIIFYLTTSYGFWSNVLYTVANLITAILSFFIKLDYLKHKIEATSILTESPNMLDKKIVEFKDNSILEKTPGINNDIINEFPLKDIYAVYFDDYNIYFFKDKKNTFLIVPLSKLENNYKDILFNNLKNYTTVTYSPKIFYLL